MRGIIKNNKIVFGEISYDLTNEILTKYYIQTNDIYLLKDLSWSVDFETSLNILRKKRDEKLRETDYVFLSDTTKVTTTDYRTALKAERQALRDITENLETVEDVLNKLRSIR